MIRMLIVGYMLAIRSERQLCREVQVNLTYRWFCDLGLEGVIPDHSAFSRARNERIEMRFAHLKRILRLSRLRLRGRVAPRTSSCSLPSPRTSGALRS